MLLVSGGHCQFLIVSRRRGVRRLGGTIDDAPGEAFDKTARILGLPQPGGPAVEAEAAQGDAGALRLSAPASRPARLRPVVLGAQDRRAARTRRLYSPRRAG